MILVPVMQLPIMMILFTLSLFLNKARVHALQSFPTVNLYCSPHRFSDRNSKEHLWDKSLLDNELISHRSNIYQTNRINL
jgi:hypothetical protein